MGAPTVYRWDDSGAPSLAGVEGTLIDVLRGCLVDGYGAKAGAGWTIAYEDGNSVVFRPGAGRQFFYRVDDRAIRGGEAPAVALLQGYESASDAYSGTGPFPSSQPGYICKSQTADATVRSWAVIANDAAAYIWINTNASNSTPSNFYTFVYFFGDLAIPSGWVDSWASAVAAGKGDSKTYSIHHPWFGHTGQTNSSQIQQAARSRDGATMSPTFVAIRAASYKSNAAYIGSGSLPSEPYNGATMIGGRILATDGANTNTIRGWFPGLMDWNHTSLSGNLSTREINGTKLLLVWSAFGNFCRSPMDLSAATWP